MQNYVNPTLDSNYFTNLEKNAKIICDDMIYYCFDVLTSHLHKTNPVLGKPTFTNSPFPLFVTWYIGREKHLRGCIGTFSPLSLHDGLKEYAITSAFQDTRFNPIRKEELPKFETSHLMNLSSSIGPLMTAKITEISLWVSICLKTQYLKK